MTYLSRWLRKLVEHRANERCEYCHAQKSIVISLEIDHIIPKSAGGETQSDNLCLACRHCNGLKSVFIYGIDPETDEETALFHPRVERWGAHFDWSDDGTEIVGLTGVGRATISRLRLNRVDVVDARRRWVAAGWHPPRD